MKEKKTYSFQEAMMMLPDKSFIDVMRASGTDLLKAAWNRQGVIEALKRARSIDESTDAAKLMEPGYGLMINDENGTLFIETAKLPETQLAFARATRAN